ncbi:sortase [Leuconostoc pseudomesenteroides]|uniref:sortase n=2 Tax=Lactobacillaceae TaxID=33958 RepID=UPI0021A51BE1|nr:sortase [Leuconostoc pseudomesenteroides]MCT4379514.1 sortase [Leuconostoc pseudomesenteroides]
MKLRYCLILFVIVIGIIAAIFNKTSEEQRQLVNRIEKRNAKTDAAITDEDTNKILLAGAVITIPKINVEYPIFNDTSDESLAKGAGFLEDFDRPDAGEGGLTVIAAHRLWCTHLGFLRLNELGKGDTFQVLYQGMTYHYRIFK